MKTWFKIYAVWLLSALSACTPMGNLTPPDDVAQARVLSAAEMDQMASPATRIHAGDTLRVVRDALEEERVARGQPDVGASTLYVVRSDGSFSYRHAGRVQAAGKTPDEVAQYLKSKLDAIYREPNVTVNIVSSPSSKVVVGGAVRMPGALDMSAVATVQQGLFASGGMLPDADPSRVALLRLDDRQRYRLYIIDFSRMLEADEGGFSTLAFQRGDILFIPKSAAGNMGDGVQVYINQILPFARSLGISYGWGETRYK